MNKKISLTIACGDYDRTRALMDGTVTPEGIELNYIPLSPSEIFWRMLQHEEFDASELSLSNYMMERSRGINRFIAIPVFPSRMFRHSCIFVNVRAGINSPQDLKGKRVGVPEYHMTAALCIRGFLQDDYGVDPRTIMWFTGGQEEPGRKDRMAHIRLPEDVHREHIGPDQTLNQMLDSGEIDALITAHSPSCFIKGSPNVKRLFPNYKEVEMDYYSRTRIFPIMHTFVIKTAIYEKHPWVAQSLYKAFVQAKKIAYEKLHETSALSVSLPWLISDLESLENLMGPDFWPYGVEPNRVTLEAETRWSYQQGLSPRKLAVEELFAPSTLAESRL